MSDEKPTAKEIADALRDGRFNERVGLRPTMTRSEAQAASEALKEHGEAYFDCTFCKGPTVIDEDGCCVYCGHAADVVYPLRGTMHRATPQRAPARPTKRPR